MTVLRIGTRGSKLALVQAGQVRDALLAAWPELAVEIVPIRTTGDRITDRPLAELGGKGLFTKEIEAALLAGAVDVAVHSLKDVETQLPDGLAIDCTPPRADPRDVLIAHGIAVRRLADLPHGAVVGTSALRRRAQLLAARPDLAVVSYRGNVDTRLEKLARGEAAANLLAKAGLDRLGRADPAWAVLEPDEMLPAVAQGALGLERRAADARAARLLAPLHDAATFAAVTAERALLAALDGSCRTPIAALAHETAAGFRLDALIASPDGTRVLRERRSGTPADAARLGADAGAALRAAGPGFFNPAP